MYGMNNISKISSNLLFNQYKFKTYFIRNYCPIMSKTACVVLAEGAEEMEFVIAADVLRRAGVSVTIAGLQSSGLVKGSRDITIQAEKSLESLKEDKFDVIVLPGGLGGSKAFAASTLLGEVLKKQETEGRLIAAICAAPIALAAHDICVGQKLTSYPSVKDQLTSKYEYIEETVVQDGKLITSRGPGTAFDFALKISQVLVGEEKAAEVAKGMLLK